METMNVIVIPETEWRKLITIQDEILGILKDLKVPAPSQGVAPYLTAKEFMDAVKIKRTKFDQLVHANKIKVIKKDRKIYVAVGEVERYFRIN